MSLADIRDALAAQLEARTGLRAYAGVSPQVTPPAAVVDLGEIQYHYSMDTRTALVTFEVVVLAARSTGDSALDAVDEMLSPSGSRSIRAAVEADPTLGGLVSHATCRRAERVQPFTLGGVELVGSRIEVEVIV